MTKFNQLFEEATAGQSPQRVHDFVRAGGTLPSPGSEFGPTQGQQRKRDPLGAKTLGFASAGELALLGREGKLRLNRQGQITTPKVRQAARKLFGARKVAARSQRGDGSVEGIVGSYLRRHGLNRTGTAGILGNAYAESTLDPGAMEPGTHNGGLWGFTAGEVALSEVEKYAAAKGKSWEDPKVQTEFLLEHVSPETIEHVNAASSPEQAAQIFMEEFEKPGVPRLEVREQAAREAFTSDAFGKPSPKALERLRVAKQQARKVGINPTPWNGDVAGGGETFTWVRADAKGMLQFAESALGKTEGTPAIEKLAHRFGLNSVTQPWCANFISNGLIRRGFKEGQLPVNPNYVPSFEEWAAEGKYAHSVGADLADAKPGDLLAFSGQHIGVYVGGGEMISGNFGDQVSRDPISAESAPLSMIIRPGYKGGRVKVPDARIEGTGTTESIAGGGAVESGEGTSVAPGTERLGGAVPVERPKVSAGATVPISALLAPLGLEANPEGVLKGINPEGTIAKILARRRL